MSARKPAKSKSGKKPAPKKKTRTQAKPSVSAKPPRAMVGVVAPSAPAPLVELEIAVNRLVAEGYEVFCHPQVKRREHFFAGSDTERALAFLDYAFDPDLQVVWAARGGYGAVRLLPILDEVTAKVGVPEPKTFVGFSDATVLLEYVRKKWGWRSLHAPMPATSHIERVQGKDWKRFADLLDGTERGFAFDLKPIYRPENFGAKSAEKIRGEIVGGNLAIVQSLVGTPYAFDLKEKILFLEEVTEAPYRIDRMIQQLLLAGALCEVRAIVLGTFTDCRDSAPQVLAAAPKGKAKAKMKPLRPVMSDREAIEVIFGELGETLGIPVFYGVPVGHGTGAGAMELGVQAELSADGTLRSL